MLAAFLEQLPAVQLRVVLGQKIERHRAFDVDARPRQLLGAVNRHTAGADAAGERAHAARAALRRQPRTSGASVKQ